MACRENNRPLSAALILLILVLAGANGCGGSSGTTAESSGGMTTKEWLSRFEEEEKAGAPSAAKKPPPLPQTKPRVPVAVTPANPSPLAEDGDQGPASAHKPRKPKRPKDVADWKRDDYYSAKRDGDPQLIGAVSYLGKRFAGNESAAELLIRLFEMSADDPRAGMADEEGAQRVQGANANLTKTIVAALAANGTPKARQTLERFVDDGLRTGNNQVAVSAALKVLLSRPDAKNEDLLLRILTTPDGSASEDQMAAVRAKIRGEAIAMLASTGSETLRARLASAMITSELPQTIHEQLWNCLKRPQRENLAAQMIIYQSDRPDLKVRESLEQSFASQSGEALSWLLGARLPKRAGTTSSNGTEAADPYRVAERMWSPNFAAAIQQRLLAIDTLAKGARLVGLASTISNPSVRAALLRILERHWDQGPKGLEMSGAAEGMTREPGFVVVLKMLPHKDAIKVPGGKDRARMMVASDPDTGSSEGVASGRNGAHSMQKSTKTAAKLEVRRRQEQTSQQWAEFSRGVVAALCQGLLAIAKAKQAGDAQAEWNPDDADLSVKPHPRAAIVAAYRLDWPDSLNETIPDAPLLRVRYVRIEQKAQPVKVLAYYRRQLTNGDEHAIPGGLWIESLGTAKEQGNVRSIDVFLTKASASVPGLLDQEQELTVEILTVECAAIAVKGSPQ